VQFGYDLRGLRTSAQFANGTHAIGYAWDNAGRLASTTAGGKTVSHQYDAAGNRIRTTWPDGFFTTQLRRGEPDERDQGKLQPQSGQLRLR
jgi:YD repeat-containing protein